MPFDPIQLSKVTEDIVCKDEERKYYRFRFTRFYGGSATADVTGCNLRCAYCWSWKYISSPQMYGRFYKPEKVAETLNVLSKGRYPSRLTGGEPTLCFNHLIEVIKRVKGLFILETNGLLLDRDKVKELSNFRERLLVRVSLKGVNSETFEKVTGAEGRYFNMQIDTLRLLSKYGVPARPALMVDLFKREDILRLQKTLLEIDSRYIIEPELFINYGGAWERMKKVGLSGWLRQYQ